MCVSRCEENAGLYTALRLDNVFNLTGQTDQLVTHSLTHSLSFSQQIHVVDERFILKFTKTPIFLLR